LKRHQADTSPGTGCSRTTASHLFTPEYDYERVRGVLAVRDARDLHIIDELDTHGIDPHEVTWLPDGRSLLGANGGIMTHPRNFRRKLNIPTMDPSLCVIDSTMVGARSNGDCGSLAQHSTSRRRGERHPRQWACSTKVSLLMHLESRHYMRLVPDCDC